MAVDFSQPETLVIDRYGKPNWPGIVVSVGLTLICAIAVAYIVSGSAAVIEAGPETVTKSEDNNTDGADGSEDDSDGDDTWGTAAIP